MSWSPPIEVTTEHYYFDSEAYAWRHDGEGSSPTLTIAQDVLEDYEGKPADLVAWLNLRNIAREIERAPKELIVRRRPTGLALENFTRRR